MLLLVLGADRELQCLEKIRKGRFHSHQRRAETNWSPHFIGLLFLSENNCSVMPTVKCLNTHYWYPYIVIMGNLHCFFVGFFPLISQFESTKSSPGCLRQKSFEERTLLQHVISPFLLCYCCRDYEEANHIRSIMRAGVESVLSCFHATAAKSLFFFFRRAGGKFQHPDGRKPQTATSAVNSV